MKTILPLQLLLAPSLNDPQPLIIYHGRRCPDGFGAALAAWLFYGDKADYLPLDHGDIKSLEDLRGKRQAMDGVFHMHHLAHAHNQLMTGNLVGGLDAKAMASAKTKFSRLSDCGAMLLPVLFQDPQGCPHRTKGVP